MIGLKDCCRPSDDAPHQDIERRLFYGRNGSLCYPLSTTQIKDILQRQKAPVLEIQELGIEEGISNFTLFFVIENIGKVVCRTHFLNIRIPLKIRFRPVLIDVEQPSVTGSVSHYLDTRSQRTAFVLEIEGRHIYPGQKVRNVLKISPFGGFTDAELYSRSEDILSITIFSDPPSEVRGQTQMAVW